MLRAAVPAEFEPPAKDEKPDDKKKLDKEFTDKTKQLADKTPPGKVVEQVETLYVVNSWLIDPLIRNRAQLMASRSKEASKEPESGRRTRRPTSFPELGAASVRFCSPPAPAGGSSSD